VLTTVTPHAIDLLASRDISVLPFVTFVVAVLLLLFF